MRKVFYKSRIIFNLLTILSILLFSSQVCALNPGDNSPAFSLNSNRKTGEKISLSQFSGKIVYLDIWASWCGTCAESLSWMQKLQDKFGSDSFQVIAVNVDEERNAAEKILRKLESSILVAFDPEGMKLGEFRVHISSVEMEK